MRNDIYIAEIENEFLIHTLNPSEKEPVWSININFPFNIADDESWIDKKNQFRLKETIINLYEKIILNINTFKSIRKLKKEAFKILSFLKPTALDYLNKKSYYNVLLKSTIDAYRFETGLSLHIYKKYLPCESVIIDIEHGVIVKNGLYPEVSMITNSFRYVSTGFNVKKVIQYNFRLEWALSWVDANISRRLPELKYYELIVLLKIVESKIKGLKLSENIKNFFIDEIHKQSIGLYFENIGDDLPF